MPVKLIKIFLGLTLLVLIGAAGLLYYIRPTERLDLQHDQVNFSGKAMEMLQKRKLSLTVTEPELNALIKQKLSSQPLQEKDITVMGADFKLKGDRLDGIMNLKYKENVSFSAAAQIRLTWNPPYITAEVSEVHVKSFRIPQDWFHMEPMRVDLNRSIPDFLAVKQVRFEQKGITVDLKQNFFP